MNLVVGMSLRRWCNWELVFFHDEFRQWEIDEEEIIHGVGEVMVVSLLRLMIAGVSQATWAPGLGADMAHYWWWCGRADVVLIRFPCGCGGCVLEGPLWA